MIEFACPRCKKEFSIPDQDGGRMARCRQCGCVMVVPTSESCDLHGRGEARILPDAKSDGARKETLLDPLGAEGKRPSWFLGILIPLIIVGFAVWFGFVKQDIFIGGSPRGGSPGFDARGPAAIWGGVSTIAIALGIHAGYFWARIRRFRTCAQWGVGLAILLFLGATLAAALVQDTVEEHEKAQCSLNWGQTTNFSVPARNAGVQIATCVYHETSISTREEQKIRSLSPI
jgi:DNA-directed RNA polymerase subunit RPC12/RpoP